MERFRRAHRRPIPMMPILLLILGYTPFRAVTASLVGIVVVGAFNERTRLSVQDVVKVFVKSARDVVSLVAGRSVF